MVTVFRSVGIDFVFMFVYCMIVVGCLSNQWSTDVLLVSMCACLSELYVFAPILDVIG